MKPCCDKDKGSPLETLSAGLDSLPRQLRGFPEVREALLAALGDESDEGIKRALADWRPSGNDFGLMWLEMWAYVADVLGFYDERIANETYIRTAVRRPSLRRIVELLGHTPRSGIAGTANLAGLADGNVEIVLPQATGFRSGAFDGESPQVFETGAALTIHPLKNEWTIGPFTRRPTVDVSGEEIAASEADKKKGGGTQGGNAIRQLLFEPAGFGLAADELVLFDSLSPSTPNTIETQSAKVAQAEDFEGRDGRSYVQVTLDPPVAIEPSVDLFGVRARRPVQTAVPTSDNPKDGDAVQAATIYLDGGPQAFRKSDPIIIARNISGAEPEIEIRTIDAVETAPVEVNGIPPEVIHIAQPDDKDPLEQEVPSPVVAVTKLAITLALPDNFVSNPGELTIHYDFVDGGTPTNTAQLQVTAEELTAAEGVPLEGIAEPPAEAIATAEAEGLAQNSKTVGVLEQQFLLSDTINQGALIDGRLAFNSDGRASFLALDPEQLPAGPFHLPVTIYGNIVPATRGESVAGEVLGNGDARLANQQFKLKKKPLTYLHQPSAGADSTTQNTLDIWISGIRWQQVGSFFGCGPEDTVYVGRHDDDQNTIVTFGDGIRGARLPSGIKNVVANYRFGAGVGGAPGRRHYTACRCGQRFARRRVACCRSPGQGPGFARRPAHECAQVGSPTWARRFRRGFPGFGQRGARGGEGNGTVALDRRPDAGRCACPLRRRRRRRVHRRNAPLPGRPNRSNRSNTSPGDSGYCFDWRGGRPTVR